MCSLLAKSNRLLQRFLEMFESNFTNYFTNELPNMSGCDIDSLVHSRLIDLADQIRFLYAQGDLETAALLQQEGCELAAFADSGDSFLYINDLTNV